MIVYKYLHSDRIDVLENSAIRFTQPAALNDPFETMPCFTDFKAYLQEQIENRYGGVLPAAIIPILPSIIDTRLAEIQKMIGEHFGMLSLAKKNNNALMWAHYADAHKGFVIGFDSDNSFFKPGNGKAVDGLREVKYSTKRKVLPKSGLSFSDVEELKRANEYIFFTKSADWTYEEELRILANPKAADLIPAKVGNYDICLFKFPSDCVKEIIFGCRMPSNKRKEIADLVSRKYPDATLLQAELSATNFDLDVVPYLEI